MFGALAGSPATVDLLLSLRPFALVFFAALGFNLAPAPASEV